MVEMPSPEMMRMLLDYDPEAGTLTWRERTTAMLPPSKAGAKRTMALHEWNARFAAKPALTTLHSQGYVCGSVNGYHCLAHRAAWVVFHGQWPNFIDHINGNKADNRIVNLRAVSRVENQRNLKLMRSNTSGVSGVGVSLNGSRWLARIWDGNKQVSLGVFDTFDEAVAARRAAESRLGYHPNHGRRK